MTAYAAASMPRRAPLRMRAQTFSAVGERRALRSSWQSVDTLWRLAAFVPTLFVTGLICVSLTRTIDLGGILVLEAVALAVLTLTFVWLVFSVNTACLGLMRLTRLRPNPGGRDRAAAPLDVAVLIPIYNEAPWDVFGNASAMLKELGARDTGHQFTVFILSDTRNPSVAAQEERAFAALYQDSLSGVAIHYRRRQDNIDKKVGNIADWIENWGAAYDAMVVLDADSLMSGAAIRQLADALARDPDAGLIQSRPMLIGAETLFGRSQQFSNSVYGWLAAEGLESWSQLEGNYWGHNAIIRTRAFAASARLPYLTGRRGAQQLILSHDFVEAGLLRRAGWAVRFLPRVGGSFEETPQTLIDYIIRDRRWCHGNMQHMRLLAARGFHLISRVHLLQGALAFLMSPAWLAVVVLWAFVSRVPDAPSSYFSAANPLQPIWPEPPLDLAWIYLLFVYGMLLFPKLASAVIFGLRRRTRVAYGSNLMFAGSMLVEIVLSVIFAPIMMVQHTCATAGAVLGRQPGWAPQNRTASGYTWREIARFHWVETVLGAALLGGIVFAGVSPLVLPIALSLVAAIPLSKLSAIHVADVGPRVLRLDTPHTLIEPRIIGSARSERAWLKALLLEVPSPESVAAE